MVKSIDFSNLKYLVVIPNNDIIYKNLEKLKFGLTDIEFQTDCFAKCPKLTEIDFGNGNHKFGANSFANCTKLEKLIMPNQTNPVEFSEVFGGCTALKTLECDDSDINDAFGAFKKTLETPGTPKTHGGLKPPHSKKKKSAKKSAKSKKKGSKKKSAHSKKKGSKKTSKKKI